jgi:protein-L-isoaspartate(D-aspartate) O-methyltransferase
VTRGAARTKLPSRLVLSSTLRKLLLITSIFVVPFLNLVCQKYAPPPPGQLQRLRSDAALRRTIFQERSSERAQLVALLQKSSNRDPITDPATLEAIGKVPRHAFVDPPHLVARAYMDRAIPIGYGQTISTPYDVAMMTQNVYSIEILKDLAVLTQERLSLLGYGGIHLRGGDGYYGWPEAAPFQGIIVTCASGHIPPPLLQQLAPGGRMVIPVGDPYGVQRLILVTKDAAGSVKTEDRMPVRFVPMTGSGAAAG